MTSLAGFFAYQKNHAWTWEHQALVRARVVAGSAGFRHQFERARKSILCLHREKLSLQTDVIAMRQKMNDENCRSSAQEYDIKLDKGGIVDIELLIQYWVCRMLKIIRNWQSREPRRILSPLWSGHLIIDKKSRETLLRCYQTYMRHLLNLKLMERPVRVR